MTSRQRNTPSSDVCTISVRPIQVTETKLLSARYNGCISKWHGIDVGSRTVRLN